jgi:hypothetical protein
MTDTPRPNSAVLQEATRKPSDGVDPRHSARGLIEIIDPDRGIVRETDPDGQPRKKIAICGFATSSRPLCPFFDASWSIWGMNQLYRHVPRMDRTFDIHVNWNEEVVEGTDYVADLNQTEMPVYMTERVPGIEKSVVFPIERMIAKFGLDYFTSSIAIMLSLAIDEIDQMVEAKLAETVSNESALDTITLARSIYSEYMIGIYGVDLIVGEEYTEQKPCTEMWIGMALARGIKVFIPPQSALCKQQYRYGYEREPAQYPISRSELGKKNAALLAEKNNLIAKMAAIEGALELNEHYTGIADIRLRGGEYKD